MTDEELERAAYARGDLTTAGLLARIADLQAALGQATAHIESLKNERDQFEADLWVARQLRAYPGDPD